MSNTSITTHAHTPMRVVQKSQSAKQNCNRYVHHVYITFCHFSM